MDIVSGSKYVYTDKSLEALSGKKYYRVAGVKLDSRDPNRKLKANSGSFSRLLSNLEDNRQQETVLTIGKYENHGVIA